MRREWQGNWKRKILRHLAAPVIGCLMFFSLYTPALAAPSGGVVTTGAGSISQTGAVTTVTQTSDKLGLNWNRFGIGVGEKVQFLQPGANSIALNRIMGSDATVIYGAMTANGKVFLINPSGVLFAPGAQVNVGGLVASTLNLTDKDFIAGKYSFNNVDAAGSVINQGSITASGGGYAVFLGPQVKNEGVIGARLGTVGLISAERVTLDFVGDKLLSFNVDASAAGGSVTNSGKILADGGTVLMSTGTKDALLSTVVNNTGLVQAQTVNNTGGVIRLEGGTVNVAGTLDASAPNGGNGGFIETSGASVGVKPNTAITTAAPTGKAGTWLIDPVDITIAPGQPEKFDNATLGSALDNGNVIITTNQSGSAFGNITVAGDVNWSAGNSLTLTANNSITINSNITASGNGAGLVLTSLRNNPYILNNGAQITLSGTKPTLSINGKAFTVINTLSDLRNMNANLTGYYFLGADMDAGETASSAFTPIGYLSPFAGTFDGGTHTISGLTIDGTKVSTDFIGLFSKTDGASIRNVRLVGGKFIGGASNEIVASLVGLMANGVEFSNCYNSGTVSGGNYTGGLVGEIQGGKLTSVNLYNKGAVTGGKYVGGLIGYNAYLSTPTIINSYNIGTVSGGYFTGGLVGANDISGSITINGSYNNGAVSGGAAIKSNNAGGLVGYNSNTSSITINNSYNNGAVTHGTAIYNIGGLVGSNAKTVTINNSYNSGKVDGITDSNGGSLQFAGGLVGHGGVVNHGSYYDADTSGQFNNGILGLHTAVMMKQATFTDKTTRPPTPWNTGIWQFSEGSDYPRLISNPLKLSLTSTLTNPSIPDTGLSISQAYMSVLVSLNNGSNGMNSGDFWKPEYRGAPGAAQIGQMPGLPLTIVGQGINR